MFGRKRGKGGKKGWMTGVRRGGFGSFGLFSSFYS